MRTAIVAVVLGAACKREPTPTVEPTAPPRTTEAKHAAATALDCPEDTVRRGAAPPDGLREWCESAGGVSDGPFRSWHEDGQRKSVGSFERGVATGEWTTWYDNGQLRTRGRYEGGAPVGEWERFERDGTPAPPPEPEAAPEAAVKPIDGQVLIGIPICDRFIERVPACIEKAPEAAREPMRTAVRQTIEAWKEAAAGPGADALEPACTAAYEAWKQASANLGCDF